MNASPHIQWPVIDFTLKCDKPCQTKWQAFPACSPVLCTETRDVNEACGALLSCMISGQLVDTHKARRVKFLL